MTENPKWSDPRRWIPALVLSGGFLAWHAATGDLHAAFTPKVVLVTLVAFASGFHLVAGVAYARRVAAELRERANHPK